jgi:hypothetical protein
MMQKLKVAFLVILAAVLVDFAVENTAPPPDIKLFKFVLGQVPTYLLAYSCLAVGLVVGWMAHALRTRRKKRETAAAATLPSAPEEQISHQGQ